MSRVTALAIRLALAAAAIVPVGPGAGATPAPERLTARGMGLSPDGQLLVFVGRGKSGTDVFTLGRKDATVTQVTGGDGSAWTPSFSSDGLHVYYSMSPGTGARLVRMFARALDGSETLELPLPQQRVFADTAGPAVSRDNKWMAFTAPPDPTLDKLSEQEREAQDAPWRLYLVRLGSPSSMSYTTASAAEAAPAFSHDCALLTYRGEGFLPFGGASYWQLLGFSTDGALATCPVALFRLSGMLDPASDLAEPGVCPVSGPAHAASANCLVGAVSQPSLMLVATDDDGRRVRRAWPLTSPVEGLCVTPDGSTILGLFDPEGGTAWELWSFRISDGEKRCVASNQLFTDPLAWHLDKDVSLPLW